MVTDSPQLDLNRLYNLADKAVIVTGAAQGMGEAMARAFAGVGAMVNIASKSAFHPMAPSLMAYAASKAGVVSLTRSAAMEAAKDGIRVNAVCPDNVTTPGQGTASGPGFPPEVIARFMPPLGRAGRPDEIAAAVLFLASDAVRYITGQTLVVDGGYLIG